MNLTLREAVKNDLPRLNEMAQGVVSAERPFNAVIKDGEPEYYDIGHLIRSDKVCLMVAESDEGLVGCGYAQIKESKSYLAHKYHAYLGFMYVEPEWRGQALNAKIMERLFEWVRSKGAEYCYLDVYADNQAAVRAYEKLGFHSSIVEMQLKL